MAVVAGWVRSGGLRACGLWVGLRGLRLGEALRLGGLHCCTREAINGLWARLRCTGCNKRGLHARKQAHTAARGWT